MRLDETSLLQVLSIVAHMLQFTPCLIFKREGHTSNSAYSSYTDATKQYLLKILSGTGH
jgi:hypothetical protein